jgi:ubiquinone biosynthesis protein
MGPTFTKLGQLLSTRVDLLPDAYTDALSRLQEGVEPFSAEEAKRIVEEELGVRVSQAFASFEEKPIAAASLGQVHRARLPSGRDVAVKVQRPGVRDLVFQDFEALEEIAGFMDEHTDAGRRYRFSGIMDEMRRALLNELDYRREATHLRTLSQNLQEFPNIVVPQPIKGYITQRVLTMEYVHGRKITELSPLGRMEIDGAALAEELFQAYLKQVLLDGFFHADPHPGNVFLTDDNRIALIDVGMIGRLAPDMQDDMLRMLLAMAEGRGRDAAEFAIEMGEETELFEKEAFKQDISRLVLEHFTIDTRNLQLGRVVMELTRTAAIHGLIIPSQLTMLGKTLLNLDQVGRALDPEFEPNIAIQRNGAELMRRRMLKSASPSSLLTSALEANEFLQRLPGRLNRVLDAVAEREFEVQVRVKNDRLLMDGLQKIANRIATGAILAALIISASLMMRVETAFRIFGYPGLAMLLFGAALLGSMVLLLDILTHDRWTDGSPEGPG